MKVKVTKKDIEAGTPCSLTSCPIAHAIKAKLHGTVEVDGNTVVYARTRNGRYQEHVYSLPAVARKFVKNYDEGKRVKPFQFEIVPEQD